MEKTDKSITEETKDDEIVELKDEELGTITAGLGTRKHGPERKPAEINTDKQG
mgnify:CR=1 FL=1